MKKIIVAAVLLAAVGWAAWFFVAWLKPPRTRPAPDAHSPSPDRVPAEQRPGSAGGEARPEQPPEPEPAPIRVRFEAPDPPRMNQPVPVTLWVESSPKGWPAEAGPGARLDLLLRLPPGVKLASQEGWSPAKLPPEEKEDASGPWSVYEKQVPLQIKQGVPPEALAREKIELTVTEEGTNWIISARARLTQDSQSWQAFGVIFATLRGNEGQFHEIPKAPLDIQSAQAN